MIHEIAFRPFNSPAAWRLRLVLEPKGADRAPGWYGVNLVKRGAVVKTEYLDGWTAPPDLPEVLAMSSFTAFCRQRGMRRERVEKA